MSEHVAPDHLRIGILETIPHDGGPTVTTDLVCCQHCGYIWQYQPGSGRVRGWCMKCNGFVCGRKYCLERVPCRCWQKGIDFMEKRIPLDREPITVAVGGEVPSALSSKANPV